MFTVYLLIWRICCSVEAFRRSQERDLVARLPFVTSQRAGFRRSVFLPRAPCEGWSSLSSPADRRSHIIAMKTSPRWTLHNMGPWLGSRMQPLCCCIMTAGNARTLPSDDAWLHSAFASICCQRASLHTATASLPLPTSPTSPPPSRRRSMHLCKCSQIDLLMVGEGRETGEADGLSDGGD